MYFALEEQPYEAAIKKFTKDVLFSHFKLKIRAKLIPNGFKA